MDPGILVGAIGIGIGTIGIILGVWWTRHQARRSARSVLHVHIASQFELSPSSFEPDLSRVLSLTWMGMPIDNFVCLSLHLRLTGYHDIDDPSARVPPPPGAPTRPRLNFSNLRVLSIGTVNNDPNLFEIPIAKANFDKALFLNVVRLRSNAEARFHVMGTKPDVTTPVGVSFAPGYLKQVDVTWSEAV